MLRSAYASNVLVHRFNPSTLLVWILKGAEDEYRFKLMRFCVKEFFFLNIYCIRWMYKILISRSAVANTILIFPLSSESDPHIYILNLISILLHVSSHKLANIAVNPLL